MTFFFLSHARRGLAPLLVFLIFTFWIGGAFAANIGTVVPIVGNVADLTYDANRGLVYLANVTENCVAVYSVGGGGLLNCIPTGLGPASVAMSPDGNTLYVANTGSFTVSVVDLNAQQKVGDIAVGNSFRPDAVAVGSDGMVLVLGPPGLIRIDPTNGGAIVSLPVSVPAVPPGVTVAASAVPSGFRAGLVVSPSGSEIIGLSTNRLFVYDVASGQVLRSRNVTGLLAILSVAPDGSRFMAGPFLFDTQTMAILGRAGTVSATITGGSAFSVDGNSVYATFSTQPPINPLNTNDPQNPGGAVLPGGVPVPPQAPTLGVLQVLRASSLTPQMGLRLPEALQVPGGGGKIIASPDGQYLFAISTSGLTVIPIGRLNQLPVVGVSSTHLVLSVNVCNVGIVSTEVGVNNLGGGRLTYSAVSASTNAAVPIIVSQGAGVAPSAVLISFNPRSVTATGTQQVAIVIVSPQAVNIEPAILVSLNFTSVAQTGSITPINGVAADQQLDAARQLLYIANYTQDQIEVFSLASQSFLPPIRVGNRPRSMAMLPAANPQSPPSTMVVTNTGSETLSVVDLNQLQVVQTITMGPIPLNATPLFPKFVAASTDAILFTAVPLPAASGAAPPANSGVVWQLNLETGTAFPRLNLGQGVTNAIQPFTRLLSPPNGGAIVLYENTSTATQSQVVLYDPIADTFPVSRTSLNGVSTTFRGTVSATSDSNYYLVDDTIFDASLGSVGTLITPTSLTAAASLTYGVSGVGANAVRVQQTAAQTTTPIVGSLELINPSTRQVMQQILLPEAVMDITPSSSVVATTATRLWPPNVVTQELGVNGQTQILPRELVVDSANNVYLLTVSGLTIVPLNVTQSSRPPSFNAAGVVNAASFTGPVAPGSLISIFGSNLANPGAASALPLPTNLGGVCVTANGSAIPLLYTSPTQINAQLPPGLSGRVTLAVNSALQGQVSQGVQVQVNATAPAVFSTNMSGLNWAELYHAEDFSLVTPSNPASRDKFLVLYASGLGAVNPIVPQGQAGAASPLSIATQTIGVQVGFTPYIVEFAGLAPGFVGVYQINLKVPGSEDQGTNTSTCSAPINGHCPLPVVITAGSASSSTTAAPLTYVADQ